MINLFKIQHSYMNSGLAYRIISILVGLIFLAAGGLKLHGATALGGANVGLSDYLVSAVVGGAELLFGGWLVLGLAPASTRLLALAVCLALSNIALYRALAGDQSCGCFGQVRVEPWIAVGVDALAVLGFLLARPALAVAVRARRVGMAAWSVAVVVAALAVILPSLTQPVVVAGVAATVTEQDLIDRVIRDIEGNSATYSALAFEADVVSRNTRVKEDVTTDQRTHGSFTHVTIFSKQSFFVRILVSGPNIRWDRTLRDRLEFIESVTDEHWIEYYPDSKRAWLRKPSVNFDGNKWRIERTTWSLRAPIARPRDWFAGVIVRSARAVDEPGRVGVEVEAESPPGTERYQRYVVFFSAQHRHLPIRHEVWNRAGTIMQATDIEFQKLPERDGWAPQFAKTCLYDGKSKGHDTESLVNEQTFTVRPGLQIDPPVAKDAFVVPLPAGTFTTDVIRAGGTTQTISKPAPRPEDALKQLPLSPQPTGRSLAELPDRARPAVWPLLVWNAVLLTLCVAFRSRFFT